ncbi:toll-like receptor 6 isoform X2 [Mytilus trossulus]
MAAELQEKEQRPIDSRPLPDGKKFHVFISYSESDRSWVETVIQHLQNDYNFTCFEHSTDFIPGRKIRENIEYAILNSVKTLCVITEDYNQSFWCQFEVEFAILKLLAEMKENVIIPVLKEECEIPGYLKPFTYINGTGDMNVWLPKLASAIELEGEQYNHELALNRVKNAVNRNRNLDLLHEETSHISCRGPVFRWKYVPESLSIAPMKVYICKTKPE